MQSYRFHCRNVNCGYEYLLYKSREEFDIEQYSITGHSCQKCGFHKCGVIKSQMSVSDGFQPGFQRNIMKHCETYTEYKGWLKIMGLVELGYEDLPEPEEDKPTYWNDELIKMLYDANSNHPEHTDLSNQEIAALKAGKMI